MTENPEQETQENGYNPFRTPKFAALERLICSYLIESLTISHLESVIFICRAALMLPKPEIEKIQLDPEPLTSIYTVAQRLQSAKMLSSDREPPFYEVFTATLDFERDIKPWVKFRYYPHLAPSRTIRYDPENYDDRLLNGSDEEVFHLGNKRLTENGYQTLIGDFLEYAAPITQQIAGLLTELISPDTYTDMLLVYKGVKKTHD